MLATVRYRDLRRGRRLDSGASPRRETLDMARRSRYAALLRRWALERLPAGSKSALDAGEWIREILAQTSDADTARDSGSPLARLRARLVADRPHALRARPECTMPSTRVEQLIGCDRLDRWEDALASLPRGQRDLVILRIEFGLDDESIATEMDLGIANARAQTVNALAALIDALGGGVGRARARAA